MQFPAININGTTASQLLEDHMVAIRHLDRAIVALGNCAPHGRDYQTLADPQSALRAATAEHSERQLKLRQVKLELEMLCEHFIS